MATRQFIGTFMRRAREAHMESSMEHTPPPSVDNTFNAIVDTATKQVIRGMIRDGFISEERDKARSTAKRLDLNKIRTKDIPQCPPGWVFSRKRMDCIPKTENDRVDGFSGHNQLSGPNYNVWGRTGMNGDGYAYEEPAGMDANASHWDVHENKATFCFECKNPADECSCGCEDKKKKPTRRRS